MRHIGKIEHIVIQLVKAVLKCIQLILILMSWNSFAVSYIWMGASLSHVTGVIAESITQTPFDGNETLLKPKKKTHKLYM